MDSQQYFSHEGLEKLKAELEERQTIIRPEIARRLKEAKEEGDTSENAAFDAAKEAQATNEGRIEEIKSILENAVIFSEGTSTGTVSVGSTVKVESKNGSQTFTIVGSAETDPLKGFISNESPLGRSLLGSKKGSSVEVVTPKGKVQYKITSIS